MYKFASFDAASESARESRVAEREIMLQSIALMEAADQAGPQSLEAINAIHFVNEFWFHFIEDLGRPGNALPTELRARLISIGLFLIRSANEIQSGKATSFRIMIHITQTIAERLK